MDAYFNTPMENLTTDDLTRIMQICSVEIDKRKRNHYDRLYESIIDSLNDMVKHFPYETGLACPNCGEEYDWDDILEMIKRYHE